MSEEKGFKGKNIEDIEKEIKEEAPETETAAAKSVKEAASKAAKKAAEEVDKAAEAASEDGIEIEIEDSQEQSADDDVGLDADGADSDSDDGDPEAKKKHKGDKKDKAKEKIAELEDRVKRQMAEFDNFRKRTEKEKTQMFEMGERNIIEKMLPIVDNFERGLEAAGGDGAKDAFAEGMEMVYKQLMGELESLGVKKIDAVGKEFDPAYHNAVMQVESEEFESGMVAQELQKGYMYHDTVIRHSMVAVVQ